MGFSNTRFRNTALIAGVLATLAINPAFARESDVPKRAGAGFASGAIIGAAAGGPVGMVVGAAAGVFMGDRSQQKSDALAARKAESDRLGSSVQFRTGQTAVRDSDKARIARLGALVADLDDVRVRVSGFADSRGDDELNESLSRERAEMVARELEKAGVPKERLIIEGMGERFASLESNSDDQAFERSVEIRFESTASLASN